MTRTTMKKIIIIAVLLVNAAFAQLSFDRTRVIFDHAAKNSQSILVSNTSPKSPFLAQSWLENENGQKISSPITALPVLQRINPREEKQIKLNLSGDVSMLPKDRETLLYLNVRGVPPTSDGNKLNISIQSRLKVFYRPKGMERHDDKKAFELLNVTKKGNSLILENPTAYHLVIYAVKANGRAKSTDIDVLVKPFSTETINMRLGNDPMIFFVNDQGGTTSMSYQCNTSCTGTIGK